MDEIDSTKSILEANLEESPFYKIIRDHRTHKEVADSGDTERIGCGFGWWNRPTTEYGMELRTLCHLLRDQNELMITLSDKDRKEQLELSNDFMKNFAWEMV